jgi:plastocyanin
MNTRHVRTCRRLAVTVCAASVMYWAGMPAMAANHRVLIDGMAFHPAVVQARPGDTITWLNKDLFIHNVTVAARHAGSGELAPGKTWRYTVPPGASFDYGCTLHPTMTGRVEVRK